MRLLKRGVSSLHLSCLGRSARIPSRYERLWAACALSARRRRQGCVQDFLSGTALQSHERVAQGHRPRGGVGAGDQDEGDRRARGDPEQRPGHHEEDVPAEGVHGHLHHLLQHVHAAESVQLVRAAVPAARRDDLRLPDEDGAWLRPSGVCVGWRGSTGGRAAVSRRSRPLVVPRSDSRARPFSRCCRRCATSGTTSC